MGKFDLVEKRESLRDFQDKALTKKDRLTLEKIIKQPMGVFESQRVEIEYIEDGKFIQEHIGKAAGYNGVLIKAPCYLLLFCDPTPEGELTAGFVGETIILDLLKEEVGSCWISINDSDQAKKNINRTTDKELVALIGLGYAKSSNFFARFFGKNRATADYKDVGYVGVEFLNMDKESSRLPITDFVYNGSWGEKISFEEIQRRGFDRVFYYMKFAPSYGNRQPWKFILKGENTFLAIKKEKDIDPRSEHLDGGIVMKYFEIAMHEMGYRGAWNLSMHGEELGIDDDYVCLGYFQVQV